MDPVEMQLLVLQTYLDNDDFPTAYHYIADQIEGQPGWHPEMAEWFRTAAAINGSEPNLWKEFVFASNGVAMGKDPYAPETIQQNQHASDTLALTVINDYMNKIQNGEVLTPDDIGGRDLGVAVNELLLPPHLWAGGPFGLRFGFSSEHWDSLDELAAWAQNSIKAVAAIEHHYLPYGLPNFLMPNAPIIGGPYSLLDSLLDLAFTALGVLSNGYPAFEMIFDSIWPLLIELLSDPIILDLDGDGIELTALSSSATQFDLDGDGFAEKVGWVSPHDGLLFQDSNENEFVDGVDELFGNAHVDGFDELVTLDANLDGKISELDPAFSQLYVWRDLNSDGISTPNEIVDLAGAGISAFNLSFSASNSQLAGNTVVRSGSYVRQGVSAQMSSVDFALDDTQPIAAIPTDADILDLLALPNLPGFGVLPDLRTAMFYDGVLKQMVDDLVRGDQDIATFEEFKSEGFLDILYRWAGVDTSAPHNPEDLPFITQLMANFMGRPFGDLNEHQIERIEVKEGQNFVKAMGVQFLFQSAGSASLQPIVELSSNLKPLDVESPTFSADASALVDQAITSMSGAEPAYEYLERFTGLSFDPGTGSLSGDFNAFVAEFIADEPSFASTGYASGGGGGGGGRATLLAPPGEEFRHPWTAWYEDQGSLVFTVASAMGIDPDYVLNVTGWRWLRGGMSEHDGTSGDDLLSYTVTTYTTSSYSWTAGSTTQSTSTYDQRLFGYEGNDELRGNDGVDSLIGGLGNDLLKGGSGSDMYVYALGDGLDRIIDDSGSGDVIYFSSEFDRANLVVTRPAGTNDFLLHFGDPAAGIILTNQWSTAGNAIEQVFFVGEDGLTAGEVSSIYLASLATAAANTITGSWAGEKLIGLDGNDTLAGGAGNDVLEGGAGQDILNGENDNDLLDGGDAADTLDGGLGNDVLMGGPGNDILRGWVHDDTYVFNLGDGQDTIQDFWGTSSSPGWDKVLFGSGITAASLVVTQINSGTDLLLSIAGTTDSILLDNTMNDSDYRIEQVQFADGTSLTHAQLVALSAAPTSGNDVFYGSYDGETLEGGAGNDTLTGQLGNDVLIGGPGNDILRGWVHDDTYVFNLGDGQDIIQDFWGTSSSPGWDTVLFGAGITSGNLVVTQLNSGTDLLLSIAGTTDSILLDNTMNDGDYRIEKVQFADGSSLTHAQLVTLSATPTSGNDVFYGSYDGETLEGGAGNDTLTGQLGNDVLIGGPGNDVLRGWVHDDTYVFNLGDGQDVVQDFWGTSSSPGWDKILFGTGIAAGSLVVTQLNSGTDLLISIAGTTDSILLDNTMNDRDYFIEQVQFADQSSLSHAQLVSLSATPTTGNDVFYGSFDGETLQGGDGNDSLYGRDGNDTLKGGIGNDLLDGGNGTDRVDYSDHLAAVTINLAISTAQVVSTGETDTIVAVENLTGGSGNDHLTGSSAVNSIFGGDGNDRLKGDAGNDQLSGGLGTDVAVFNGLQASYAIVTTGGTVTIVDNQATIDGNDGSDTISSIETLEFKGGIQGGVASPIILDLDGGGIETSSAGQNKARIDLNGDGRPDKTAWIGSGEGLLFLDRNGDGTVSGVGEFSFIDDVAGAASDLAGLAAFDGNGDGQLDSSDSAFAAFGVWRDLDGDGKVDKGEVSSLAQIGIASLGLAGTPVEGTTGFGEAAIVNIGTFTLTDGTTGQFADAALTYFSGTNGHGASARGHSWSAKLEWFLDRMANDGTVGELDASVEPASRYTHDLPIEPFLVRPGEITDLAGDVAALSALSAPVAGLDPIWS